MIRTRRSPDLPRRHAGWAAILLVATSLCACPGEPPSNGSSPAESERARPSSQRLSVAVVNYPLAYFASRIGGDLVDVSLPVPDGVDPAYWSPSAEAISIFQQADVILLNGARYARWVERATLPHSRLVDTSRDFQDDLIEIDENVTHTHGPSGAHDHAALAFTTWIDPTLATKHARGIAAAFSAARPDEESTFWAGLADLEADLLALDDRLTVVAEKIGSRPLLFSHPVYAYLIRRYALRGRSLHWEPDAAPTPVQWHELEQLRQDFPAQWMIWEAPPLAETIRALEALGIRSAVFTPGAIRPPVGDYIDLMNANLSSLTGIPEADRSGPPNRSQGDPPSEAPDA